MVSPVPGGKMYKVCLFALLLVIIGCYLRAYALGRRTRSERRSEVSAHKTYAITTYSLFLLFIAAVEIRVRTLGGSVFDGLMATHLIFAVPLLVVMTLAVVFMNGLKSRHHPVLVHLSLPLFFVTAFTGILLIVLRF